MDPELPFFYHTLTHHRFYKGLMPEFSAEPSKKRKPKRLPRYELLGTNDRVTLSVRGDTSVRTKFHNVPIDLPPPPGARNTHVLEHSYALNSSNK